MRTSAAETRTEQSPVKPNRLPISGFRFTPAAASMASQRRLTDLAALCGLTLSAVAVYGVPPWSRGHRNLLTGYPQTASTDPLSIQHGTLCVTCRHDAVSERHGRVDPRRTRFGRNRDAAMARRVKIAGKSLYVVCRIG